jgi:hypothetical protein
MEVMNEMTRTEQFLQGYDSCRRGIQHILYNNKELLAYPELLELAEFEYYKEDGKDWNLLCHDCKNYVLDMDYNYVCKLKGIFRIKDNKCELREVKAK